MLAFFLTNSLLSSQNIYLGSCPNSIAACSSYTLRNMAEYKDKHQVIISLFWTFTQLRKQVLDIERDIKSTVIDSYVFEVVHHAFN